MGRRARALGKKAINMFTTFADLSDVLGGVFSARIEPGEAASPAWVTMSQPKLPAAKCPRASGKTCQSQRSPLALIASSLRASKRASSAVCSASCPRIHPAADIHFPMSRSRSDAFSYSAR